MMADAYCSKCGTRRERADEHYCPACGHQWDVAAGEPASATPDAIKPNDDKPKSTWLTGPLQILAGLAGAVAIFAGLASFAGWQYTNAYYSTLGIPQSSLAFSTQYYGFQSDRTLAFILVGLFSAVIGGGCGVTIAGAMASTVETLAEYFPIRWRKSDEGRTTHERRFWIFCGLCLILVASIVFLVVAGVLLAFFWTRVRGNVPRLIGHEWADQIGPLFVRGAALIAVLSSLATFLFQTAQGATKGRGRTLSAISFAAVIGVAAVLLFAPSRIGVADAQHDVKVAVLPRATIVFKGSIGASEERPVPLTADAVVPNTEKCDEFVADDKAPRSYCQLERVAVILRNDGRYFVGFSPRRTYAIPENRIVRITFVPEPCVSSTSGFTDAGRFLLLIEQNKGQKYCLHVGDQLRVLLVVPKGTEANLWQSIVDSGTPLLTAQPSQALPPGVTAVTYEAIRVGVTRLAFVRAPCPAPDASCGPDLVWQATILVR